MTEEQERHRDLIREAARKQYGLELKDEEFILDSFDQMQAVIPGWQAMDDKEDIGLYQGDSGKLVISVVGAPQFGNERVAYYWQGDDFGEPSGEVVPFEEIELAAT